MKAKSLLYIFILFFLFVGCCPDIKYDCTNVPRKELGDWVNNCRKHNSLGFCIKSAQKLFCQEIIPNKKYYPKKILFPQKQSNPHEEY